MKYEDIIKSKHLILTDQGVFEPEYRMMYKGTMDQRLKRHIESQPMMVNNISSMAGMPMNFSRLEPKGEDSISVSLVTTQLSKLRFNTTFEIITKDVFMLFSNENEKECIDFDGLPEKWLSPTFRNGDSESRSNRQTYTLDWKVPEYIKLYITMEYHGKTNNNTWRPAKSYLHCKIESHESNKWHEESKGWFVLPTGNVYENSEICFGETYMEDIGIVDATKKNIDLFYSTPWNSDLTNSTKGRNSSVLFRFCADTNQQLGVPCPAHILMESFSKTYLENISV